MPRLPSRRWTRLGVPILLAAAVALLVGIATGAGSSRGASTSSKSGGGVATVQRRDLVATDTESGTLGYAHPHTIFNRLSGTITYLPSVGQVVKPGGTLYKVSGQPVVLMAGTVPAYRDLSAGVTDGPDVKELKQNLVALGFDPSHQLTINNTFDSATTTAVEAWQAALGETQTGVVSLGDVVFLPSSQRITQVNTVLGSTGGASSGSAANSTTGASLHLGPTQAEFVSLTTTATTSTTSNATTSTSTTSSATTTPNCPTASTISAASAVAWQRAASDCPLPNNPDQKSNSQALQLQALIALLKAETAELRANRSSSTGTGSTSSRSGSGSGSGSGLSSATSGSSRSGSGGTSGASGGTGASGGSSGTTASASAGGSSGGTATAILQSTSTQVVVTVNLDATKQSEAVVGEPVTVELPDGSTVDGTITEVSPVAQTSSSSTSSGSGSGSGSGSSGGGSSSPSATIPVTITLNGHQHIHGLDQAAVSVNFEQQKATNVLSVPVTALIATAGGGYAVQEAAAPHQLLPVSPGLFAAGYVQISGAQITPGLQVTDSQG